MFWETQFLLFNSSEKQFTVFSAPFIIHKQFLANVKYIIAANFLGFLTIVPTGSRVIKLLTNALLLKQYTTLLTRSHIYSFDYIIAMQQAVLHFQYSYEYTATTKLYRHQHTSNTEQHLCGRFSSDMTPKSNAYQAFMSRSFTL